MKTKKLLSAVMAVIMAFSIMPMSAFAVTEDEPSAPAISGPTQPAGEMPDENTPPLQPLGDQSDDPIAPPAPADPTDPAAPKAPADPVAKIGDVEYGTLKEAIDAAQDGDTVVLLKDASGCGIVIETGRFPASGLTIDFAGHIYTVNDDPLAGSTGYENQCFQLKKDNYVTMKNGYIAADNENVVMIIQNYCNLTLEGMQLNGFSMQREGAYTLSNNCGNVVINNSRILTAHTPDSVAFDVYGGMGNYSDVTVTVKGNSFIQGKVEVSHSGKGDSNATLNIEGGHFTDEIEVADNEKLDANISGGSFYIQFDKKHLADAALMVSIEGSFYFVGDDATDAMSALKPGDSATVIAAPNGEVKVPEGVEVTNNTGADLVVNGQSVADGDVVAVPVTPAAPAPEAAPSFDWHAVLASINALGGNGSLRVDVGSELSVPHFIWQAIYGRNITLTFVRGADSIVVNGARLGANFNPDCGHMLSEFSAVKTNPNTGVKL